MLSTDFAGLAFENFCLTQTRGWWCGAVWCCAASLFFWGACWLWLRRETWGALDGVVARRSRSFLWGDEMI